MKKVASFVLASLSGSTYRSVRLTTSLAPALLDGLLNILQVFMSVTNQRCFKYRKNSESGLMTNVELSLKALL